MELVFVSPKRSFSVKVDLIDSKNYAWKHIKEDTILVGNPERKAHDGWRMVLFNTDFPEGKACLVTSYNFSNLTEITGT